MRKLIAVIIALIPFFWLKTEAQNLFFDQNPPGNTPQLFAPNMVATGFNERDITISPDGNELFYGFLSNRNITIMHSKKENGHWTEPEIAPFAQNSPFFFLEPCFSADGKTLFFLSTTPPAGEKPQRGWHFQNIWASEKQTNGSWGEIYMLDTIVNFNNAQFYPSLTKEGTLYFTTSDAKTDISQIYRSKKINGQYQKPELLPDAVNKMGTTIFNAFISPDESFLIGCVAGVETTINPGKTNYCIFFRSPDDRWSNGIVLGEEINIPGSNAISASVSPDGKYLFFSAQKTSDDNKKIGESQKLSDMLKAINLPQNGNQDIYWMDAVFIENLRKN